MSAEMTRPFERIYTMPGYFDGPCDGIADFDGRPHAYASVFDVEQDEYNDLFELRPVDDELLQLALESWDIYWRYERWFIRERSQMLPADVARRDELERIISARSRRSMAVS